MSNYKQINFEENLIFTMSTKNETVKSKKKYSLL